MQQKQQGSICEQHNLRYNHLGIEAKSRIYKTATKVIMSDNHGNRIRTHQKQKGH